MTKVALSALALSLWMLPNAAQATCLAECSVNLATEDCSAPIGNEYSTTGGVYAWGDCQVTCCAPPSEEFPNGSCSTDVEPLDTYWLEVYDDTLRAVDGEWIDTMESCNELPLLLFPTELEPGFYSVAAAGIVVETFVVVEEDTSNCSTMNAQEGASWAGLSLLLLGVIGRRRRS